MTPAVPNLLLTRLLPTYALTAFLLSCSCGHSAHKRTYPPPDRSELLSALSARRAAVSSLNVQTRTTSWMGGDRVAATVLMLVERSGKLRFEAEVSLKGTVAALATDRQSFQLLDLERQAFHTGPACPQNVARLVRIPLAPQDIAPILLGDGPVDQNSRLIGADWDGNSGAERLEWETKQPDGSNKRVRMLLQKRNRGWVVLGVEGTSGPSGGQAHQARWWRVRYDDFVWVSSVYMPGVIRFAEPGASFDDGVEIKIRDRRMNPQIPPTDFHIMPPPNMFVEQLGCDEGETR